MKEIKYTSKYSMKMWRVVDSSGKEILIRDVVRQSITHASDEDTAINLTFVAFTKENDNDEVSKEVIALQSRDKLEGFLEEMVLVNIPDSEDYEEVVIRYKIRSFTMFQSGIDCDGYRTLYQLRFIV